MIRQVAIIGSGTMGRGIAYLSAVAGYETVIHDVHAADLIIKAVPEDIDLKKNLFSQADLFCGEETILASNTSSISISVLANSVESRDRFVGLHFFNPPHAMKLIEIVRGERTSDHTIEQAREVAERMGKQPIIVRDVP